MSNYYEDLGLDQENKSLYTQDDIRDAYRRKVLTVHPDKCHGLVGEELEKAKEEFRKVRKAYFILGDAQKRRHYDEETAIPLEGINGDFSSDYNEFLQEIIRGTNFVFAAYNANLQWVKNELNKKISEEYLNLNGFVGIKSIIYAFIWVYLNPVNWILADNLGQEFKYLAVDNYYRTISMGDSLVFSAFIVLACTIPTIIFFPAVFAAIGIEGVALSIVLLGIIGYEIYDNLSVKSEWLGETIRETRATVLDPFERIVFQPDQEPPLPSKWVEVRDFGFFKSNKGICKPTYLRSRVQGLTDFTPEDIDLAQPPVCSELLKNKKITIYF